MDALRIRLLFLNIGHSFDHLFMLLYATAVIAMERYFDLSYGELLALATPGFVAFGAGALPSGWLGDRWSRNGMIAIFFIGIGAASMVTGLASTPLQIGAGLLLIGLFASIYHPVGIAMVVDGPPESVGRRLGVNGVYGNLGVAAAAIVAGALAQWVHWRAAFLVPGAVSILVGIGFVIFVRRANLQVQAGTRGKAGVGFMPGWQRALIVLGLTTLFSGLVFNATTVSLPKVFDERLAGLGASTFGVGVLASIVYAIAAFTQIAVGRAIDRFPVRPILVWLAAALAVALLLVAQAEGWAMFLGALIIMALVFGQIPIGDTLVARYTPSPWRARVYAVKYVITLGVASLAVPSIAILHGWGNGFSTMFVAMAVCAALVAAAGLALPSPRRAPAAVPAE